MPSGRHGLGYAFDVIPTGLEYLAAYIENTVSRVNVIDLKMEKKSIDYFLHKIKPDLVGISMCATEHTEGLTIAHKAKKLGMSAVVGNFHPTGLVNFFASHPDIDFVVRGEGEETLLELVKKGHGQGILGLSYKDNSKVIHNNDRPFIKNLDPLPFLPDICENINIYSHWTRKNTWTPSPSLVAVGENAHSAANLR